MPDFKKDLNRGQYYEYKALHILKSLDFTKIHHFKGKEPRYDIKARFNKKKVYIEVKYNKNADKYNNFIIELSKADGTPSGLSITKSNYYMLFSYSKYYLIETIKLHMIVKQYILNALKEEGIQEPTPDIITNYILNKTFNFYGYMCISLKLDLIIPHCIKTDTHTNIKIKYIKNDF